MYHTYTDAQKGCIDKRLSDRKPSTVYYAHGVEWQAAALTIEQYASGILGLNIDLGRTTSLAEDIHGMDDMPDEKTLTELHIDMATLRESIGYLDLGLEALKKVMTMILEI